MNAQILHLEAEHVAKHEAAHIILALHYRLPVACAGYSLGGGFIRLATHQPSYQEEIQYIAEHVEDYVNIYMAGAAYERLAGTDPERILKLTETDRSYAIELLQKRGVDEEAIPNVLEQAIEFATKTLSENYALWYALSEAIQKNNIIRWEQIREIALAHTEE